MGMHELLDRLLAIFFPKRCGFCGEVVEYEDYWCGRCRLPRATGTGDLKADEAQAVTLAASPFLYQEPIRSKILDLKQNKDDLLARFLASEMVVAWKQIAGDRSVDLVVPVPQTGAKLQSIGFNHAQLLAEEAGKLLDRTVRADLLYRAASSREQHAMGLQERVENAWASYRGAENQTLSGERVLLVDDVLTTGATLTACASCLLDMGAESVCAVTAVRVTRDGDGRSQ